MDSDCRAETLAEYYAKVQWAVRPTTAFESQAPIGPELLVNQGPILEAEVVLAAKKLKWGKSSGNDDIPGEFWKAICKTGSSACRWAVALCQKCWAEGRVPDDWHISTVTAIFKKGDVSSCDNYRPISLLPIGYKLFVNVLLRRLKAAGAERRVWSSQFGFRSRRGTADALFLARRLLDQTWGTKDGNLFILGS